jgi:hypothetical protein
MRSIILFFTVFQSLIFSQSSTNSLSLTIYPEFSYQGISIEYKFFSSGEILELNVPSNVDSVLYTISDSNFQKEEIVPIAENTIFSKEEKGLHTIYAFLDQFEKIPSERIFSYRFSSNKSYDSIVLSLQIPFGSENISFVVNQNEIEERVRDQNGLTFFQTEILDFSQNESIDLSLRYYNPHGQTSIEYASNIAFNAQETEKPNSTRIDNIKRYPFLTWQPMIVVLIMGLFIIFNYEKSKKKN